METLKCISLLGLSKEARLRRLAVTLLTNRPNRHRRGSRLFEGYSKQEILECLQPWLTRGEANTICDDLEPHIKIIKETREKRRDVRQRIKTDLYTRKAAILDRPELGYSAVRIDRYRQYVLSLILQISQSGVLNIIHGLPVMIYTDHYEKEVRYSIVKPQWSSTAGRLPLKKGATNQEIRLLVAEDIAKQFERWDEWNRVHIHPNKEVASGNA